MLSLLLAPVYGLGCRFCRWLVAGSATNHERVSFSNKARRDYLLRSWLTSARFWPATKTVPVYSARFELSDGKGSHVPLTGCVRKEIRLQETEATQLPDGSLLCRRIAPEQVRCTATTQVSHAGNLPVRVSDSSDEATGLQTGAVHLPEGILARDPIPPHEVSDPVTIQVSRACHLPVRIRYPSNQEGALGGKPVHLPDGVLARGLVAPEEVSLPIVVKVSGTDNLPVHISNGRNQGGRLDAKAVHLPDGILTCRLIAPYEVSRSITIEVTGV